MFLAEVDVFRQALRITFSQNVEPDEADRCLESLRQLLEGMRPGFRLLTDLSRVESMSVSCAPHIGRIMDLCNQKGVESIVRVLPAEANKDIGYAILSRFHYGPDVSIVTCDNLEEAMRLLGE